MEIKKTKGFETCPIVQLKQEDKTLSIMFGPNLDLYWSLRNDNRENRLDYENFYITKENYAIYQLFDNLYSDIENTNFFELEEFEIMQAKTIKDYRRIIKENEQLNERLKESQAYKLLFDGQKITWHSDEEAYDQANVVSIKKIEDAYILEFVRPEKKEKTLYCTIANQHEIFIRFRNSGSTYDPLNIAFMKMYRNLTQYNPDEEYHQIHLEEYAYSLKKEKNK